MTDATPFALLKRNPDVLTCIANLSNDEVFTPPEFAARMLDTLAEGWASAHDGANLWADSSATFLDPFTKSGVFLREIAKRLIDGLADEMPDLQGRVDHILTRQVFGIGTSSLTALMARRSLYCSKWANSAHSVARGFDNEDGNVWFERMEHDWQGNKCRFCGAPRTSLDRGDQRESYAYPFIHTDDPQARLAEMFGADMQFDVIIGNPPYQMAGGAGGTSDSSIYHLFVEQALRLEARFVSMVIPSRWLAGGRGMDAFRQDMLNSGKLSQLIDYPVSKDIFPGVEVKGGISYFLWDKGHEGDASVTTVRGEEVVGPIKRDLSEFDVFVRDPVAVDILHKVQALSEHSIIDILTGDTPFGIATNFEEYRTGGSASADEASLYLVKKGKRLTGFVPRNSIRKNTHLIDNWKVIAPKAGSDGGQKIPDSVLGKPKITAPGSVCTQTFIAFWVDSEDAAKSVESYYRTKFFRFLVSIRKMTQDALRGNYTWVPQQKWGQIWNDTELYAKYGLTETEIAHIETVIKPMESAA
jgi:site-specific DNA-methyltransferase (adenine-specific)